MVTKKEVNKQAGLSTIHCLSDSNTQIYFAKVSGEKRVVDSVGKMD